MNGHSEMSWWPHARGCSCKLKTAIRAVLRPSGALEANLVCQPLEKNILLIYYFFIYYFFLIIIYLLIE
jgi:hypothetical protein